MKPITKNVIFLVVAIIIIVGIVIAAKPAVAPATGTTSASHETLNPNASSTATVSPVATGTTKTYTLADVAKHKTATDCWTSVSGGVYDLTPFVNQHPGGVANITKLCGIEGTAEFTAQHGGQRAPEKELASLKIGTLAK